MQRTYERVARNPASGFHFNVGATYAIESLGYPRAEIEALPACCTSRFAGVGNPHCGGEIAPGAVVLDHACGAGMDLLLAARRVGARGRAIGVDVTTAMREQAARAALEAGLDDMVEIRAGAFENLPVDDVSVDYVISNGVINLAPDKPRVFAEIARVLRPGGHLLLADVGARIARRAGRTGQRSRRPSLRLLPTHERRAEFCGTPACDGGRVPCRQAAGRPALDQRFIK